MRTDTRSGAAGRTAGEQDVGRLLVIFLLACLILPVGFVVKLATTREVLFPDFFGLWSFGRFVLTHAPSTIYDDRAIHAFQIGFGMPATIGYPFPYPPWILLVLAPFGALPYSAARIGWLALTFGAYAAALTPWRWDHRAVALLLVAPTSAVCFLVGQNGFLSAALMLGGMRLLHSRPLLAGALLASVAYKPNLAILVPFVLLFGQHWRAMAGAAAAAAALSLAATLAFGLDIWGAWLAYMHATAMSLTAGRSTLLDLMPTVTAGVLMLRGGVTLSHAAQAAAAIAAILAIWRVRARHDIEAQAVLPLATALATPYAFHYDLPMVTGAVLAVVAARMTQGGRFGKVELPMLLLCVAAPMFQAGHFDPAGAITPAIIAATVWILACSDATVGGAGARFACTSRVRTG